MSSDKDIEKNRYTKQATIILDANAPIQHFGSDAVPEVLKAPYLYYEKQLRRLVKPENFVLEIGAGTGIHTQVLLELVSEGHVFATDISESALTVLRNNTSDQNRLTVITADMEILPFADASFDVVVSAGSLSYGDPEAVLRGILRVLKPGGFFCCVDSLNHNFIYRLNRMLHFIADRRSLNTLKRMPTMTTLAKYENAFGYIDAKFFGSISWTMPVVKRLLGSRNAAIFSDMIDRWIAVKRSAFKFVMLVRKINR